MFDYGLAVNIIMRAAINYFLLRSSNEIDTLKDFLLPFFKDIFCITIILETIFFELKFCKQASICYFDLSIDFTVSIISFYLVPSLAAPSPSSSFSCG